MTSIVPPSFSLLIKVPFKSSLFYCFALHSRNKCSLNFLHYLSIIVLVASSRRHLKLFINICSCCIQSSPLKIIYQYHFLDYLVDSKRFGNKAKFVNHSSDPNVIPMIMKVCKYCRQYLSYIYIYIYIYICVCVCVCVCVWECVLTIFAANISTLSLVVLTIWVIPLLFIIVVVLGEILHHTIS